MTLCNLLLRQPMERNVFNSARQVERSFLTSPLRSSHHINPTPCSAEIPFQHEAYSDGNVETETVGDTQVCVCVHTAPACHHGHTRHNSHAPKSRLPSSVWHVTACCRAAPTRRCYCVITTCCASGKTCPPPIRSQCTMLPCSAAGNSSATVSSPSHSKVVALES